MRIAIMVEGKTEKALLPAMRKFLATRLAGRMPRLDSVPYDGRLPKSERLKGEVQRLLNDRSRAADAVIAVTDVYTGSIPREFSDAADAKDKMRQWVGKEERFHPHAAQYEFEAWLLPYWSHLQRLAGHNAATPGPDPEKVDHDNPPSRRISELFRKGAKGKVYVKARDATRILREVDLMAAVEQCRELKALVNTILVLSGGSPIA